MNVSELAKQFNTTSDFILATLRSLKLKAKDSSQELNAVVVTVLKGELVKIKDRPKPVPEVKREAPVVEKEPMEAPVSAAKKAVKKKTAKDTEEMPQHKDVKKKTVKKETVKKIVKKTVKKKTSVSGELEEKKDEGSPPPVLVKAEEKKASDEKETAVQQKTVVKKKMSQEPMIALKPLVRRRKKTGADSADKAHASKGRRLDEPGSETNLEGKTVVGEGGAAPVDVPVKPLIDLEVKVPITVKDFSAKLSSKPSMLLKQLMNYGIFAHINQSLDEDVVRRIASDFGFNLTRVRTQEEQLVEVHKQEQEDPSLLKPRAPVVTFMGHVDHGKTSLLDRIRKSKIADGEHGGITQHIGAYSVAVSRGRITFLDTPGHEAFTAMRVRGVTITDLVVIVIAVDEGIMPQTVEAIDHARAANVPILIALNKIDRRNADIERVKKQLADIDLLPEDWGGKTVVVPVSAVTGDGIDTLLEMMLLEAEMLELKANAEKTASGIVVEAHLSQGKGPVTTVIVQSGTLREGDMIVVGPYYAKIRALFDDLKRPVKSAGPSIPVEVLGLPQVPDTGEMFYVVSDEKQAREITYRRREQIKNKRLGMTQKITLEDLYANIQKGAVKALNVIIKADVQGSLEALRDSLAKIPSDKVKINFIHLGVGEVNGSDVLLAYASSAIVIAFHVGIGQMAKRELEKTPVDVRSYRIIYDAVSDIRNALEGLLEARQVKRFQSRIEVREVFKLSKSGIVAGCYVTKGKVTRKVNVDLLRKGDIIFSGKLSSLKRFKDDVKEVTEGMECGLTLEGFDKFEAGDIVETYEVDSIAQKL